MCQALFQVLHVCYPILSVLSPNSPMRKMYNNLHFTEEFEVYNETEAQRKVKLFTMAFKKLPASSAAFVPVHILAFCVVVTPNLFKFPSQHAFLCFCVFAWLASTAPSC